MINQLILEVMQANYGDPKRIQHFIKVYQLSKMIGEMENLDDKIQEILEITAIFHDIAIPFCLKEFQTCNGKMQEEYGPALANDILQKYGLAQDKIDRICYLIGHHHTYNNIQGLDYQILVEADFIVNLYEDDSAKEIIKSVHHKMIKTKSGKEIFKKMFGL